MIGVLGGGQLGRMLALAGLPLGLRFRFLDPSPAAPAASLGELVCGDLQDPGLLPRFVEGLDLVTYEFENVPIGTARWLAARTGLSTSGSSGSLAGSHQRKDVVPEPGHSHPSVCRRFFATRT